MICVNNNALGGETVFLDSKILLSILDKKTPDLLDFLLNQPIKHERSGDENLKCILEENNDDVFVSWNYYY